VPAEPPELADERRTSPIELLWDLVFVFAVTQVTTLFSRETTWAGFGRSMLILALGLLIAIGMWWTYFDRVASAAEERLGKQEDAVLAAADAYSYLHLVIVAGIIIFAVGVKSLVQGTVSAPLSDAARLALCGGVAVYLIGNVGFRPGCWARSGMRKPPRRSC